MSMEEKKGGKGKGGKYLEKGKEKKNGEEQGEKYLEKVNIWSMEEKKNGEGKVRNNLTKYTVLDS